ncbi:uncharacterized protein LOC141849851 [Brevipalpus obovatus]|uniref:uncharacterized protein LOC141849851 n=1 Tax=Brevipalpus obovatus TaxID=246614 RepID=UPI003D9FAD42
MKKSVSKTLVTWYEREQLRLYSAPRFDTNEIQELKMEGESSSKSSSNFSLIQNAPHEKPCEPGIIQNEDEGSISQYNVKSEANSDQDDGVSLPQDVYKQASNLICNQRVENPNAVRVGEKHNFAQSLKNLLGLPDSSPPELTRALERMATNLTPLLPSRTATSSPANGSSESFSQSHTVDENSSAESVPIGTIVPCSSPHSRQKLEAIISRLHFQNTSERQAPYPTRKPTLIERSAMIRSALVLRFKYPMED